MGRLSEILNDVAAGDCPITEDMPVWMKTRVFALLGRFQWDPTYEGTEVREAYQEAESHMEALTQGRDTGSPEVLARESEVRLRDAIALALAVEIYRDLEALRAADPPRRLRIRRAS